jgi:hypothetical protein
MPFVKGQSGNPAGRPLGSRNKVNREAEAALEAVGGGLVDRIIDHAGAGHPTAMRLCMDRMLPMGKHRPVAVVLPPVNIPDYALMAAAEISRAFAAGSTRPRRSSAWPRAWRAWSRSGPTRPLITTMWNQWRRSVPPRRPPRRPMGLRSQRSAKIQAPPVRPHCGRRRSSVGTGMAPQSSA